MPSEWEAGTSRSAQLHQDRRRGGVFAVLSIKRPFPGRLVTLLFGISVEHHVILHSSDTFSAV